ncbi:hypothetical protein AAMO2058_000140100 [Amorphochlora amoebiformis]
MESSIDEGQPLHRSHRRYSDGVDNAETTAYPLCNRLFCTETEWDTVEVGKPRRGFWGDWPGPWMARENSCESDYQYSKYIAELYCTGACIFILAIGIVGYILSRKNSAPSSVLYLNTIAVGAMGILAHATQTRVWEALELLTLEHFCVLFAITSCTVAWDLQKEPHPNSNPSNANPNPNPNPNLNHTPSTLSLTLTLTPRSNPNPNPNFDQINMHVYVSR